MHETESRDECLHVGFDRLLLTESNLPSLSLGFVKKGHGRSCWHVLWLRHMDAHGRRWASCIGLSWIIPVSARVLRKIHFLGGFGVSLTVLPSTPFGFNWASGVTLAKRRKCRKRSSGRQVREFNGLKVAYLSGRTSQLEHEDRWGSRVNMGEQHGTAHDYTRYI